MRCDIGEKKSQYRIALIAGVNQSRFALRGNDCRVKRVELNATETRPPGPAAAGEGPMAGFGAGCRKDAGI
jgi:hypothetical protein